MTSERSRLVSRAGRKKLIEQAAAECRRYIINPEGRAFIELLSQMLAQQQEELVNAPAESFQQTQGAARLLITVLKTLGCEPE